MLSTIKSTTYLFLREVEMLELGCKRNFLEILERLPLLLGTEHKTVETRSALWWPSSAQSGLKPWRKSGLHP